MPYKGPREPFDTPKRKRDAGPWLRSNRGQHDLPDRQEGQASYSAADTLITDLGESYLAERAVYLRGNRWVLRKASSSGNVAKMCHWLQRNTDAEIGVV